MTDLLAALIVSAFAALIFANSRHGDFVFDDILIFDSVRRRRNLKENRNPLAWRTLTGKGWLRRWSYWLRPRRELLNWSYGADVLAHDPVKAADESESAHVSRLAWWHYRNIACHAVTAAALYACCRYWTTPGPAMLGACLFAAHPLCCPSVASISGRSSLMCGMFYSLAMLAFLAAWWPLLPLLAIAAWQSKEEAVTLPLALAALWWVK